MTDARDIRPHLQRLVLDAVTAAIRAGDLPDVAVPGASIERPKDATKGDFASWDDSAGALGAVDSPAQPVSIVLARTSAESSEIG